MTKFNGFAQCFNTAIVNIRQSSKGTGYYVAAPYRAAAVEAWRAIPGRKFADGENFVPLAERALLWNLLRTYYADLTLVSDVVGTIGPIPRTEVVPLPQGAEYAKMVQADIALRRHPHTKGDGSWWEYDTNGIPLTRVCKECRGEKLSAFRQGVLTEEQYAASKETPPESVGEDDTSDPAPATVWDAALPVPGYEVADLPAVDAALAKRKGRAPAKPKGPRKPRTKRV